MKLVFAVHGEPKKSESGAIRIEITMKQLDLLHTDIVENKPGLAVNLVNCKEFNEKYMIVERKK